jgi:hypothetical protein
MSQVLILIMEGCRNWKTKFMFGVSCKLAFSFAVYGIWRAKNEIKHAGHPHTEEQILSSDCRKREVSKGRGKH